MNRRVLIVDDTQSIHDDFGKILCADSGENESLNATRDLLFGNSKPRTSHSWDVDSAHQGDEGIVAVRTALEKGQPYALAFVDMRMPPGLNGLETTKKIWEVDPEILVVLCTAYTDFTWDEIVDQVGTSDRLLILKKPFESIEVRQMALALSERWNVARTDPLTGAVNRRAFSDHLERTWKETQENNLALSSVMIDLDFFKQVNDTHGHHAGDNALVEVAELLLQEARPQDIVSRYGGEEFCVLMPGVSEVAAAEWAEKVRKKIGELTIEAAGRQISITASLGVSDRLDDLSDGSSLVDLADQALDVAKKSGRNRVIRHSQACAVALAQAGEEETAFHSLCNMSAKSVMMQPVFTVPEDSNMITAANLFLQTRITLMAVINDEGLLVGVLAESDVLRSAMSTNDWGAPVSEFMQTNAAQFEEAASVAEIAKFLSRNSIRRVIIVNQGRPTGAIGRTSLLRWLANSASESSAESSLAEENLAGSSARKHLLEIVKRLQDSTQELMSVIDQDVEDLESPIISEASKMQDSLTEMLSMNRLLQTKTRIPNTCSGAATLASR